VEFRELDPHDDAQLRRYHEIAWSAEHDGRAWTSMWTYPEMCAAFREPTGDERVVGLCATDDGRTVGAAFLSFSLLDNTDTAYLQVWVEPELRGRGTGSALVAAAVDRVLAEGRHRVMGEASYRFEEREDGPTLRWARRNGFEIGNLEVARELALPVGDGLLAALADEARPHHTGYRVEVHTELPAELVPSYCRLVNQLVLDAPTGSLELEEEQLTPEVFAAKRARDRSSGRRHLFAVAVHEGHRDPVAGLSHLMLPPGSPRAEQWQTIVGREHRGHRLGTALKVANLHELQRGFPEVTSVHTQNAEVNAQMLAINDRLGFQPVAVVPEFVRRVGAR
jgi:GNAT superfamily N-acetyltransferase